MSEAFNEFEYNESTNRLRVGISFPLKQFNANLGNINLFVPHGECENVHIGGHVQSGGYGQLYRAFGLFGDHVRAIEVITADAEKKIISKETHPDLFYAILGGSPGNFAVLTHITIEPLRDVDYPNSRGFFGLYLYDVDRLTRLLTLTKEMSNNGALPIDYDYTVTVLSLNQDFVVLYPNVDNWMRLNFPELYGQAGPEANFQT